MLINIKGTKSMNLIPGLINKAKIYTYISSKERRGLTKDHYIHTLETNILSKSNEKTIQIGSSPLTNRCVTTGTDSHLLTELLFSSITKISSSRYVNGSNSKSESLSLRKRPQKGPLWDATT